MKADTLLDNFEVLADAPGGIDRLREIVLLLAVQGRLLSDWNGKFDTENELPSGWKLQRLDEVCSYIQRGKGPKYVDKSNCVVISQKCVQWTGFDISKARFVDEESLNTYGDERFLRNGDILWNSTGTGTVGRTAIYVESLQYKKVVADSHVTVLRAPDMDARFLWCWTASPEIQSKIEDLTSGTTNQQELNLSSIKSLLLPVPPPAEQVRIVAKVDELMALCDQLEQLQKHRNNLRTATRKSAIDAISTATTPAELETAWKRINNNWNVIADTPESVESLRALVFDLAIRGVLVASDTNDRPASELLKQIKDKLGVNPKRSELQPSVVDLGIDLPRIPLHWAWTSIQEIGKVNPRNEAKDDSIAGFVPMASVSANFSTPHQCEPRKWSSIKKGYTHLADGDIAVAKITPCFENGKSCVLSELPNGVGAGTTELLVVRPIIVAPKYILIFLKSSLFYGNGIPRMTGTAGQKRLPTEFFKSCPLPLPPLAEQKRIVAKVEELMALCDQLESELKSRSEVAEKFARSVVSAA
jgi:type I restriction enzyme S subunit